MESPSGALVKLSSPSPRRRRSISHPLNSPEFEFCNIPEPSNVPLHSADELFSHGFLLPLHSIPSSRLQPGPIVDLAEPSALITSGGNSFLGPSKRWREMFKRIQKKTTDGCTTSEEIKREKVVKRREKDSQTGLIPGSADLSIKIWPFSRNRSAGNHSHRKNKSASTNRKVNSAPCSRSNSSGESKSSRKSWPSSPARVGVHVGRASPMWQVRRAVGPGTRLQLGREARIGKVLNVNVPVCVGYRQGSSCRSDENGVVKRGGRNGNLFGLRGLFSKKGQTAILTI